VSAPALPAELEPLLKTVRQAHANAEPHHKAAVTKWDKAHAAYWSYRELKNQHAEAGTTRDVESVLRGAQEAGFGADLFIPYVYSVIETTLPRMVDALPRLMPKPCNPEAEANVDNVRTLIEHRQSKIGYQLVVSDIGKSGLTYGLGVGTTWWDQREIAQKVLMRSDLPEKGKQMWVTNPAPEMRMDRGPKAECVDPYDWFWQPGAHDLESLGWCIYRKWRDEPYVRRMFTEPSYNGKPPWTLPVGWDLQDALELKGGAKRAEAWSTREQSAGMSRGPDNAGEAVYEVWEFHKGDQVITVLGRQLPVQAGLNPFWHGRINFQIFRPTKVLHEMVGMSEPEAIEDLQAEMNAMRSQRRDNATLVLQRPFAYFEGLGDPNDFKFGPGQMWGVDGDPRELIFPIPMQDIPFSSYQEEDRLQRDIERVTGIDDTVSGGSGDSGAAETATGVQLVQAAAGVRIKSKAKRLVQECVKLQSQDFLELYQQKLTDPEYVPGEQTGEGWRSMMLGPDKISGWFDMEVEDDSMMADNPAQRVEEATRIGVMFDNNPLINQQKKTEFQLSRLGVPDPSSWIVPQTPEVPLAAVDAIGQELQNAQLIDPQTWDELVQKAVEMTQAPEEGQEPPNAPDEQGEPA
jgi:hypothetical protein